MPLSFQNFVVAAVLLWSVSVVHSAPFGTTKRHGGLPFTGVVTFGDSLSDDGHGAWVISSHTWPADDAYYKPGARRFSNGPVWVEDLASTLNLTLANHAVGGATSNNTLIQGYTGLTSNIPVPSALDQAAAYLKSFSSSPCKLADQLFVVVVGLNDVFFNPNASASATAGSIAGIVSELIGHGARNFLFATLPHLARLPVSSFETAPIVTQQESFSVMLNKDVVALASHLESGGKGVQTAVADWAPLFEDFFAHPRTYGFTELDVSCLRGAYDEVPTRTLCSDPDQYVFWDEFHPTSKVHALMAQAAVDAVKARWDWGGNAMKLAAWRRAL